MPLKTTQARTRRQFCRMVVVYALLATTLSAATVALRDTPGPAREFQVKAVFLFNFAQFVEWPPDAFEAKDSPLVIGILGADPFGGFLDEIVRDEKVGSRPLVVQRYRSVAELQPCHVLFVSGSEGAHIARVAAAVEGKPTLTVCDWEVFGKFGVMIRFVMERNHVRLRINLEAARAAGLTISSKLLRSAEITAPSEVQP